MIKRKLTTIIFVLSFLLLFVVLSNYKENIYAQTTCPPNMDPNSVQCLDYLKSQLNNIQKQQGTIQKKLKDEEYQQLTLMEKISYTNNQIEQTEKVIKSLEVEIAALDIEIKLLEKSIQEKEDNIALLAQEITVLEKAVTQRITESYKYSFVGPFELFLDIKNLSSILRKTKYLAVTRSQDRMYLEDYTEKMKEIRSEEEVLEEKKASIQVKRNDMDENKIELAEERANLNASKAEQSRLLAESKRRETEFRTQLSELSAAIASVDRAITDLINSLYDKGQLQNGSKVYTAGQRIGKQGHTGCSFGSHLHFEIRNTNNTRVNPLSGYLINNGGYLTSGIYITPVSGAYLTGGYTSSHPAIDLVSLTDGNQNLERYTVPYGLCPIVDNWLNIRKSQGRSDWNLAYLTGEGAVVRALSPGTVYYGTDLYGGNWALLIHENGERSFYLHLQ